MIFPSERFYQNYMSSASLIIQLSPKKVENLRNSKLNLAKERVQGYTLPVSLRFLKVFG